MEEEQLVKRPEMSNRKEAKILDNPPLVISEQPKTTSLGYYHLTNKQ